MNKFYKIILFLLPLLFFIPSFSVHAEDLDQDSDTSISDIYDYDFADYPFWTIQGYQNSILYDSNVQTFNNSVSPTTQSLINSLDISAYSEYPYFCVLQGDTNSNLFMFIFYKDGSLIISANSKSGLFGSSDYAYVVAYNSGGYLSFNSNESEEGSGDIIISSRNNNRLVCSNNNVYGTVGVWNDVNTLPSATYKNFNYVIYDENGNLNYNNPILNGSSGETASNNLYLKNAKWSFNNIPKLSNVYLDDVQKNLGTISFSAELNSFQKEHLDEFSIQLDFQTYLKLKFVNNDGTQEYTNQTFNIHKTISLREFYSNGLIDSNLVSNIWNGWYDTGSGNLTLNNYLLGLDQTKVFQPVVFQTQCKAVLVYNDNCSGSLTTAYNYLTGNSQNTDTSLGVNNNPYDNDYDGFFDNQFDNKDQGSNTTTNNGDGNIVNNNNPQITINNNNNNSLTDDGDSNGLLTKILLLLANNQTASSEGLSEVADTTGYVEVLGATFTAVPSNWWTVLTAAFIASIGIIVVSFVLKVILNFVT